MARQTSKIGNWLGLMDYIANNITNNPPMGELEQVVEIWGGRKVIRRKCSEKRRPDYTAVPNRLNPIEDLEELVQKLISRGTFFVTRGYTSTGGKRIAWTFVWEITRNVTGKVAV